jgi:hypothetical protein
MLLYLNSHYARIFGGHLIRLRCEPGSRYGAIPWVLGFGPSSDRRSWGSIEADFSVAGSRRIMWGCFTVSSARQPKVTSRGALQNFRAAPAVVRF